jgi:RNA polymerase sigma-70 factor (ECF subfamily)
LPVRQPYEEKELLTRIAAGDKHAFKELYRYYLNDAYSLALTFLHVPQAAEDIVQELFIKLWLKKEQLPEIEQFKAYLMVSLRNMLINELDKMKTRTTHERQSRRLIYSPVTPEDEAEATNLRSLVAKALEQLSPQQRTVYRLSREQGMDISGISRELQLAPKTVSNILSQVLRHLRSYLHEYGYIIGWVTLAHIGLPPHFTIS